MIIVSNATILQENSMINRNPFKATAFLAVPTALLLMAQPVFAESFWGAGNGQDFGRSGDQNRIAQGQAPGNSQARQERQQQMIQQLGLSPDQAEKVKGIMQQGKAQSQALHQQLRTKRQAMMKYLQSPDANESQARSMNADINDLQRQLSEIRLKSWFAMRSQMTPEQLQKMSQMKRPGGGMGPGGRGGQQGGFGGQRPGMRPRGQFGGPGGGNMPDSASPL